jgi:molybdopterin/thiamine biosynthesis adenylyltransferase
MYLTRHRDLMEQSSVKLDTKILVIGAGSIGSYTVLALAKLGFTDITVYDNGIVEHENIAPQFYSIAQLGMLKVNALRDTVKRYTDCVITAYPTLYTVKSHSNEKVIISAVDSMEARKMIYASLSRLQTVTLIDPRMAIEFLDIYTVVVNPYIDNTYQRTLFSDSEAVQEACTNKAISYTSMIAGGLVAKCVVDSFKNKDCISKNIKFDINNFDMVVL